jgi:hypothetical protein
MRSVPESAGEAFDLLYFGIDAFLHRIGRSKIESGARFCGVVPPKN